MLAANYQLRVKRIVKPRAADYKVLEIVTCIQMTIGAVCRQSQPHLKMEILIVQIRNTEIFVYVMAIIGVLVILGGVLYKINYHRRKVMKK